MTTPEPLPIAATMTAPSARLTINFTIDISGQLRHSLDLTFDQLRTAWADQLQQDPERADGQDLRRTLELWLEEQLADELAEVLRITVRDWCRRSVVVPILDHHQARREQ